MINLTIEKKFSLVVLSIFLLISIFFIFSYYSSKSMLQSDALNQNNIHLEIVASNLKEKLLNSSYEDINSLLYMTTQTTNIAYMKITFKDLIFTKENLIKNSTYTKNIDWSMNDVATDINNGYIEITKNNMYKLQSKESIDLTRPIIVKFFLYKNTTLINANAKIYFYYEVFKENFNDEKLKNSLLKKNISLLKTSFVDLEYILDNTLINEKVEALHTSYLIRYVLSLFSLSIVFAFIYFIFIKKMLLNSIQLFQKNMSDALDNKFVSKEQEQIGNEYVDGAFKLLNKILKKYMIVLNELNINKNILERKVFTDDLTGLPNQKVFELDLKNMFITTVDGFIGTIRLESLGEFTKKFGSALANHLIEEFTSLVQNKFYELDLQEATLYRFFGSEFAIILKYDAEEKVLEFSRSLEEELQEMGMRYEIENKPAYFGLIPFDKYGTIEAILHSLSDTYNIAKSKDTYYHIVSPSEVLEKFNVIEQNVRQIIENNSFEVEYGFETKHIDTGKVIMLDAIPILYDKNKEKFSIGVFISAAEKINLAVAFDKKIITTVIEYIHSHNVSHETVINLSMFSLKDTQFITWLHSIFLQNTNISKKIIFSMTAYNASTDVEVFKTFIAEAHRFGAKIILKMYTTNDFTIEQLDELDLDYLRVHKDYTNNISSDREKQHLLRTIVNFGLSNEVTIIADNVKDDKDIQACSNVGFDAISSF